MSEDEDLESSKDWITLTIPKSLLEDLKSIKIIPEEPHYKVIQRLYDEHIQIYSKNAKTL